MMMMMMMIMTIPLINPSHMKATMSSVMSARSRLCVLMIMATVISTLSHFGNAGKLYSPPPRPPTTSSGTY